MKLTGTSLFLSVSLFVCISNAADWSYTGDYGVDKWNTAFPVSCGGRMQSPIDIQSKNLTKNNTLTSFVFSQGYEDQSSLSSYELINNGHTVQLNVLDGPQTTLSISGGGLPGTEYKLAQFHMHWGSQGCVGSEHTLDGQHFPMELHLVHYNTKYNFSYATTQPDGLAVLGVFAVVSDEAHKALDVLLQQFSQLKYSGSKVNVTNSFTMINMLPPKGNLTDFIRYSGSLTTPNCNEVVTWTVFREPIRISETQLNALRALSHNDDHDGQDHPLEDNFRPTQPLNGRVVYSTMTYTNPPKPETQNCQPTSNPTTVSTPPQPKACKASTIEFSLMVYAMVALWAGLKIIDL